MSLPVKKIPLSPPPLADLLPAIQSGLSSNFTSVSVEIATPPDLRQPPFHLSAPGLSGNPRIADVGGQLYLAPNTNLSKKYDLRSIARQMEMRPFGGCLIGASAGPFHVIGQNTELMPNLSYGVAATPRRGEEIVGPLLSNQTRYARINEAGEAVCGRLVEKYPSTEFGLMGNLLGCDGAEGPLIHVKVKGRKGERNFTEAIREGLRGVYGERLISLGGVFVVDSGKVNVHVMPDFPKEPFTSREQVEGWLRFFDVPGPLVCLSVFHSGDDKDLALRMEHTHCFAPDGRDGGHYHGDVDGTREEVEYEAWFNVAEVLYRIDQPEV